jgi:hypothetical protein
MADKNVNINLNVKTEGLKSVTDIKKEIKALEVQMSAAASAGNEKLFNELKKSAGELKNDMIDLKAQMKGADPGELLNNYVKLTQGIVGGFAAATGAMSLFGAENKTIQELEKKSAVIIQTMMGLESLRATLLDKQGKQMLKQIYDETAANIKKAASWALANPIMAIAIVATAALAAGMIYLATSTEEATDAEKLHTKTLEESNAAMTKYNEERATEITNSTVLFEALKQENISKSKRAELIKEINTSYGKYLPHLLTEKSSLNEINSAQKLVNQSIRDSIAAKIYVAKASPYIAENIQLGDLNAGYKGYLMTMRDAKKVYDDNIKAGKSHAVALNMMKATLMDAEGNVTSYVASITGGGVELKDIAEATAKYTAKVKENETAIAKNEKTADSYIQKSVDLTPKITEHKDATEGDTKAVVENTKKVEAAAASKDWFTQKVTEYTAAMNAASSVNSEEYKTAKSNLSMAQAGVDWWNAQTKAVEDNTDAKKENIEVSAGEEEEYVKPASMPGDSELELLAKEQEYQAHLDAKAEIRRSDYDRAKEEIEKQHEEGLTTATEYEEALRDIRIQKQTETYAAIENLAGVFSNTIGALQELELQNVEKGSKREKEIKKKYAIMDLTMTSIGTIANIAQGIAKGFSQMGPILGAISAIALAAQGVALVANIYSGINQIKKMADGGLITEGTSGRADDVPIMASRGEYVVNAKATAKHFNTINAINKGYADGGMVDIPQTMQTIRVINVATDTKKVIDNVVRTQNEGSLV